MQLALSAEGGTAVLEIAHGAAGTNQATVRLRDSDGAPLAALEVSLILSHDSAGIAALERKLAATGEGAFSGSVDDLPIAGRWTVRLDALISDYEKLIFRGEIDIP